MRRLEDGEELDLGAAVDAMVMLRLGRQPDARITMRNLIRRRDLAALILILLLRPQGILGRKERVG